jgi:hypothetical protein
VTNKCFREKVLILGSIILIVSFCALEKILPKKRADSKEREFEF